MHGGRKRQSPSEVTIKRAENGGFIVRHHFDNSNSGPSYQPPTEHVFTKHADMVKHVGEHLGGQKAAPTVAEGKAASRKRGAGVD